MATLEELVVRIKADTAELERGMQRANGVVQKSSGGMSGALASVTRAAGLLGVALSVGAIANYVKGVFNATAELADMAEQVGVSTQFLSAMEVQLVGTKTSAQDITQALFIMSRAIGEAADGNEALKEKFDSLGIGLDNLKRQNPEQQFYTILKAVSELGTQYERTEALTAFFGRGSKGLNVISGELAKTLEETNKKLVETGQAVNDINAKAIDDAADAFDKLAKSVGVSLANALGEGIILIQDYMKEIRKIQGERFTPEDLGIYTDVGDGSPIIGGAVNTGEVYGPNLSDRRKPKPKTGGKPATIEEAVAKQKKAYEDVTRASDESSRKIEDNAIQTTRIIEDHFGDALESAMFDFKNFGDAASNILMGIAKDLTRQNVISPLTGMLSSGSLFESARPSPDFIGPMQGTGILGGLSDLFGGFFAEGGTLPAGKWGIAGENGPEIIRGGSSGMSVTPNGAGGGVTVMQNFTINAGVSEAARQEVMAAAPFIANAARAAVFEQVQRGGSAARIMQGRT
jgi:hypothetical protein